VSPPDQHSLSDRRLPLPNGQPCTPLKPPTGGSAGHWTGSHPRQLTSNRRNHSHVRQHVARLPPAPAGSLRRPDGEGLSPNHCSTRSASRRTKQAFNALDMLLRGQTYRRATDQVIMPSPTGFLTLSAKGEAVNPGWRGKECGQLSQGPMPVPALGLIYERRNYVKSSSIRLDTHRPLAYCLRG